MQDQRRRPHWQKRGRNLGKRRSTRYPITGARPSVLEPLGPRSEPRETEGGTSWQDPPRLRAVLSQYDSSDEELNNKEDGLDDGWANKPDN